jgi:hypothetical protein
MPGNTINIPVIVLIDIQGFKISPLLFFQEPPFPFPPLFVSYGFILINCIFIVSDCVVKGGRSPTGTTQSLDPYLTVPNPFNPMINNSSIGKWDRLNSKQLDSQFQNEVIHGLNCSPFEARAILDSVHKVYGDFFNLTPSLNPGQVQFVVAGVENGPSQRLKDADMVTVTLTLDAGGEDLEVKRESGVVGLRLHQAAAHLPGSHHSGWSFNHRGHSKSHF